MANQNPWLSIWTRPRETIRTIVHANPNQSLWILAFIYGLSALLGSYRTVLAYTQVSFFSWIVMAVIFAPLWGYAAFSIWSYLVTLVGKVFKGKASFQAARAAYAWSCVPMLGSLALWVVLILFFPALVKSSSPEEQLVSGAPAFMLLLIVLAKLVFSVWAIVIYLRALSEVQQFSIWRSIGNVVLAAIVAILIGVAIGFVATLFMGRPETMSAAALKIQQVCSLFLTH